MAFKIPKKKQVDHRKPLTVSSWQPRTPNRGEPLEFESYGIFLQTRSKNFIIFLIKIKNQSFAKLMEQ